MNAILDVDDKISGEYYQILRTVRRLCRENQRPPGLRELALAVNMPKSTVRRRLNVLEGSGSVRITSSGSRLVVERVEVPVSTYFEATTAATTQERVSTIAYATILAGCLIIGTILLAIEAVKW